jgi:hypothetical protein
MPPDLHLLKTSRCNFGGQNNHATKIASTCFTWKTSRNNFGGQKKGGNVFQCMKLEESMAGEDLECGNVF